MSSIKSVAVFCGASMGNDPKLGKAAYDLGTALGKNGQRLVYGGGHTGLMGQVADGVLDAGGQVLGVMPHALVEKEVAHKGLTELVVVNTMHERKAMMAEHADLFVALPGGIGTLEEIFEAWTWSYLDYHNKPVFFLNVNGFYDTLLRFIDELVDTGFLKESSKSLVTAVDSIEALMHAIEAS
jgi:uncharacterized protein (TIGR00730 family)